MTIEIIDPPQLGTVKASDLPSGTYLGKLDIFNEQHPKEVLIIKTEHGVVTIDAHPNSRDTNIIRSWVKFDNLPLRESLEFHDVRKIEIDTVILHFPV